MSESPIFIKTYDLIRWLVPKTVNYSREYRFSLALPIQQHVFAFQRHLVEAAKADQKHDKAQYLQQANVELTLLRYKIRLSRDLKVLNFAGYEHARRVPEQQRGVPGGRTSLATGDRKCGVFTEASPRFERCTRGSPALLRAGRAYCGPVMPGRLALW